MQESRTLSFPDILKFYCENQLLLSTASKKDKMKLDYLTLALRHWKKVAQEILYGFTRHELDLEMKKEKGHLEDLFLFMVCGDLVGLPVLPPYYSLRLLPYLLPVTEKWKHRILRERDLTDFVAADL